MEINNYVEDFLKNNIDNKLNKYSNKIYGKSDKLSNKAIRKYLSDTLIKTCTNCGLDKPDLNKFLFGTVKNSIKVLNNSVNGKLKKCPICPGCFYNGTESILKIRSRSYTCEVCSQDTSKFSKLFHKFTKNGFGCDSCNRFIPKSIKDNECPYSDCKKQISKTKTKVLNTKKLYRTASLDNIQLQSDNNYSSLINEKFIDNIQEVLINCIDELQSELNKSDVRGFLKRKIILQTIKDYIQKDCMSYLEFLILHSKINNITSYIIQNYTKYINNLLPLKIIDNKQIKIISTLEEFDKDIFLGEYEFNSTVDSRDNILNIDTSNSDVKNSIGYIKDIICNNKSIKDDIIKYSFEYIKLNKGYYNNKVNVKFYAINADASNARVSMIRRINKDLKNKIKNKLYL